jgi:hypothetical protein
MSAFFPAAFRLVLVLAAADVMGTLLRIVNHSRTLATPDTTMRTAYSFDLPRSWP